MHFAMPLGHVVGLVELNAIAAEILRRIAGDIGGAHDIGDCRRIVGDFNDADADAHFEHAVLPDESKIANRLTEGFRDAHRLVQRTALQQNAELVPAQARQGVAAAHPRLQHAGDLLQQLIARRVPAGVVHQFELVQIEIQQCMTAAGVLSCVLNGGGQAIFEFTAVDQSRQGIVAGLIVQRAVQTALLAHIVEHHDRADEIAGAIADRRCRILDGQLLAAAVHEHGVFRKAEHTSFA